MQLESRFQKLLTSSGEDYRQGRDALLGELGVEAMLRGMMEDESRETEVRWLAEILLARTQQREQLDNLEIELQERMRVDPVFVPRGGIREWPLVIPPGEKIPAADVLMEHHGPDAGKRVHSRFLARRLSESPLWSVLFGEILLKAYEPPARASVPLRAGSTEPKIALDEYQRTAIYILGKTGESRASDAMARLLSRGDASFRVRSEAARSLGRMDSRGSLSILAQVARDESDDARVRSSALWSYAKVEGRAALPLVCEILATTTDHTVARSARTVIDGLERTPVRRPRLDIDWEEYIREYGAAYPTGRTGQP